MELFELQVPDSTAQDRKGKTLIDLAEINLCDEDTPFLNRGEGPPLKYCSFPPKIQFLPYFLGSLFELYLL